MPDMDLGDENELEGEGTNSRTTPSSSSPLRSNKRQKTASSTTTDQLLKIAVERLVAICDKSKEPPLTQEEDKYIRLAKTWADDLQTLDPQQFLFTKKFVNKIIHEAQLGNLHNESLVFTRFLRDTE